jgi:hypothetical protein
VGKRSRRRSDAEPPGPDEAAEAQAGERPAGADDATANGAPAAGPPPAAGAAAEGAEGAEGAGAVQGEAAPLAPDGRLREVALLVEEADYLLQLYRWILLTGEVPRAQDWLKREQWPHPDYVIDVFGSWQKFLDHAGVGSSPLLARLREADEQRRDLAAREKQLAKELGRVEDLRRQAETARRAREAAQADRGEQLARAERAERALDGAQARAAQAEARLRERAETAAAEAPAAPDERVTALEDELEAVRAHREELLRQGEELRDAAAQDARTIARLSALLAEGAGAAGAAQDAAEAVPPATVLEAVERAAASATHLVFTDAARESAADSPYRRPAEILDALQRLDELARLHADPDGFGRSLVQAATELGLTYKQDVSELARGRKPHAYAVTHEGRRLQLGPHVALGSGSGAGFIARIYLHVADGGGEVPRGIYVGHVGRHLPDTTT